MSQLSTITLLGLLFLIACDATVDSDELSGNEKVYQQYIINYNQDTKKLYAEAELTRQRKNMNEYLYYNDTYDYIKLVGGDYLNFHVIDRNTMVYALKPTKLSMEKKQIFLFSRRVPYYVLDEKSQIEDIENKTMVFSYYNSNDGATYTYESKILVPTLKDISISNRTDLDVLNTERGDSLVLSFDENISEFNSVIVEFINSQGNIFFFSIDPQSSNELVVRSHELIEQAELQSHSLKERKKKKLGKLEIETEKEKIVPLLLAGEQQYKIRINAKRKVKEERVFADKEYEISVFQSINVYDRSIKIKF